MLLKAIPSERRNTPINRPYGRCVCGREAWAAQSREGKKGVFIDCPCGNGPQVKPSDTHEIGVSR